jgi:outer membrane protein W
LKTTKILVLTLLLALGFVESSNAQFYVRVGAGYGFLPVAGFKFDENLTDTSNAPVVKSYGMGIQPGLGLGYMLTKNISIELNANYLLGAKLEPTFTGGTAKWTGTGIFFAPALRISAPLKSVTPYTRMGLLIGMPQIKEEYTATGLTGTDKFTTRGGVSLGIDAGLGMDIKAGKMLNVFVELYGQALNWQPNERENTETYSGSTLATLVTYTDNNAPYYAFGNFGGKVGVSLMFGKAPKK